jgi:hypothetical protein
MRLRSSMVENTRLAVISVSSSALSRELRSNVAQLLLFLKIADLWTSSSSARE